MLFFLYIYTIVGFHSSNNSQRGLGGKAFEYLSSRSLLYLFYRTIKIIKTHKALHNTMFCCVITGASNAIERTTDTVWSIWSVKRLLNKWQLWLEQIVIIVTDTLLKMHVQCYKLLYIHQRKLMLNHYSSKRSNRYLLNIPYKRKQYRNVLHSRTNLQECNMCVNKFSKSLTNDFPAVIFGDVMTIE